MATEKSNYLKLQNGSDIRGVAIEGVEGEPVNLDEEAAAKIGYSFAEWLGKKGGPGSSGRTLKISVGRDPRLSGERLAAAFSDGLVSAGVHVIDCGLASTPAMFMSTIFDSFCCDGAVMITASHLPFNRNGFKFFDKNGGLNKGDIKEILTMAGELDESTALSGAAKADAAGAASGMDDGSAPGMIEKKDLMNRYCLHLCELIGDGVGNINGAAGLPLSGLKIVVDAGNGAGGFYADKVLSPLGAEVIGCFLEPDGSFPNHIPNPENKEAMASICAAVKEHGADLGIIFDTDVDRSAAVDENGHEMEKDLGMRHLRFKRGYKNVINKAIELNEAGEECHLAIETSGHAAIKENHFLDDGAYLATLIVIRAAKLAAEGKKISSMISSLEEPADATEIRMKIAGEDFGASGDKILAELEEWIKSCGAGDPLFELVLPNYEGVRANYRGEITVNIESDQPGGCGVIAAELKKFLSRYDELDTSEL